MRANDSMQPTLLRAAVDAERYDSPSIPVFMNLL
jgi:hypothetical protein